MSRKSGAVQVQALFEREVADLFKESDKFIGPGLGGRSVDEFAQARGRLIAAMNREADAE